VSTLTTILERILLFALLVALAFIILRFFKARARRADRRDEEKSLIYVPVDELDARVAAAQAHGQKGARKPVEQS
jgi:hypothetical protein